MSTIISQEFFKLLDNAVPPLTYSIHPSCQQYFPLFPESFIFFLFTCSFSSVWKHVASLAHTKTKNKNLSITIWALNTIHFFPYFQGLAVLAVGRFSPPTCCELPTVSGLLVASFLYKILNTHHSTLNFLSFFPLYFFLPALNTNIVCIFPYLSHLFSNSYKGRYFVC